MAEPLNMLAEANRIIREAWAALPGSVAPLAVQEGSTLADCIRAIPQAPEHNHNGVGAYGDCPACDGSGRDRPLTPEEIAEQTAMTTDALRSPDVAALLAKLDAIDAHEWDDAAWRPFLTTDEIRALLAVPGTGQQPHVHEHEHVVVQHWDAEGGDVLYRTCACGEEWTRDEERCPEDDSEPDRPAVHDDFTCEEVERRCDEITGELNTTRMLLGQYGAPSTDLMGRRLDVPGRFQALMGQLVDTMLYRQHHNSPRLAGLAGRPEDLDALAEEYALLALDSMRRASSARGKRDRLRALAAEAREKGKTTDG